MRARLISRRIPPSGLQGNEAGRGGLGPAKDRAEAVGGLRHLLWPVGRPLAGRSWEGAKEGKTSRLFTNGVALPKPQVHPISRS